MKVPDVIKQTVADTLELLGGSSKRTSYSQFGEDAIVQSLFADRLRSGKPGFYVDIGAFAPKTFSNTYALYKRGWRGINIDPTPGSMRAFEVMRRRDINLELAISEQEGTLTFFQMGLRSVLNTLSPEVAARYEKETGLQARPIKVSCVRLEQALERYVPPGTAIDLLSVDVEGLDLAVLKSNDWRRYRPEVLIVEDHAFRPMATATETYDYLTGLGYELRAWVAPTQIWAVSRR